MTPGAGSAGEPGAGGSLDPSRCPLCGQENRCAMELETQTGTVQAPCWCTHASFSAELLARVDPARRDLACICANCSRLASQGTTDL